MSRWRMKMPGGTRCNGCLRQTDKRIGVSLIRLHRTCGHRRWVQVSVDIRCCGLFNRISALYRFRPYVSCDETQSSDEMAAASEISPASATPATISANFCTLPRP